MIYFTEYSNYKDNIGIRKRLSIKQFFNYLKESKYICNTDKDKELSKNINYWYNGTRKKVNLINIITYLIYDIDQGTNLELVKERLKPYLYYIYTTASHSETNNRFRVILPIKNKVNNYEEYYKTIGDIFFEDFWDKQSLCHNYNLPCNKSIHFININKILRLKDFKIKPKINKNNKINKVVIPKYELLNTLNQPRSHKDLLNIIRITSNVFGDDTDEAFTWFNSWIISKAKSGFYIQQYEKGYINWINKKTNY